jgi:WD40 repeat protein
MSLERRTPLVLACLALAALGWLFTGGDAFVDPRDKNATMPDPRGRELFPDVACTAPTRPARTGPSPRCVVSFARPWSTLGLAPGGTLAIVALGHAATAGWFLPDAVAGPLFEALPADTEARRILVDDARSLALFVVGSQLWLYDTTSGRVTERFDGPGGTIEDAAWARQGSLIGLVVDGRAVLMANDDPQARKVVRRLSTASRAVHVALDSDGAYAAVATEFGEIAIFDLEADGASPRIATPSLQPAAQLTFARDHLLVAGSDGTLRAYDPASASESARIDVGSPLVHLAVSADGSFAATAGRDGVIRLHDAPAGTVVLSLSWHEATVSALGFGAGATLISADNDGALAVWDLAPDGRVHSGG